MSDVLMLARSEESRERGWVSQAACTGDNTDKYYLGRGRLPHQGVIQTCQSCAVRVDCLLYCLHTQTSHEDFGVWGGTTPADRKGVRTGRDGGGKVGKAVRISRARAEEIIAAADAKRNSTQILVRA